MGFLVSETLRLCWVFLSLSDDCLMKRWLVTEVEARKLSRLRGVTLDTQARTICAGHVTATDRGSLCSACQTYIDMR